jgi:hypothetical protein
MAVTIQIDVLPIITKCYVVRQAGVRFTDEGAVEFSCAEPCGQVGGIPDS